MSPEQFSVYRHEAVHQLMRLNEECEKTYQLSLWPRWDYDLEAGTLTFSENGTPQIIASIQVIGTTSKSGGTWMWAWANESLPDKVTRAVESVRAFGLAENLAELTKESLPDDEYIGWEMSGVAAGILHAKGAYRCPDDNGFVYVVYTSLRFADDQIKGPKQENRLSASHTGADFPLMSVNIWRLTLRRSGSREREATRIHGQMLGVHSAMPSFKRKANGMRKTKGS